MVSSKIPAPARRHVQGGFKTWELQAEKVYTARMIRDHKDALPPLAKMPRKGLDIISPFAVGKGLPTMIRNAGANEQRGVCGLCPNKFDDAGDKTSSYHANTFPAARELNSEVIICRLCWHGLPKNLDQDRPAAKKIRAVESWDELKESRVRCTQGTEGYVRPDAGKQRISAAA